MTTYTVGYLIGSLARQSINRKLSRALVRLAPPALELSEIPIADLPLYSYDYDSDYPPVASAFKDAIARVDAVLFVTPEYNRSIPGSLKNAIDWASRPYGTNSFARKPSAVIGASPGKIGTAVDQMLLYCYHYDPMTGRYGLAIMKAMRVAGALLKPTASMPSDARALMRVDATKLRAELARVPTRHLSAEAKAHVAEMTSLLDEAQKAPIVRQAI